MSTPANKAIKPAKTLETLETKTAEQREAEKVSNFKRIAGKRVPKIIKAIRGLHPLASANYSYTEEQAEKIVKALYGEIDSLETVLSRKRAESDVEFEL